MNSVTLIVTLVLFSLTVLAKYSSASNCTKQEELKFDELVSKVATIGDDSRRFPENGDELRSWCSESYAYLDQLEQHKQKCLKDLSKQVSGLVIFAMRSTLKGYCKNNSRKASSFIAGSKCFNRNRVTVNQCYFSFLDELLGTMWATEKMKIPHICCYYRTLDCYEEKLNGKGHCNQAKINDMIGYIESVIEKAADLICTIYRRDADSCDKLGLPPLKKVSQNRPKSFAEPIVEILLSFPEV